jgi:hypothetical protein
MTTEPDTRVGDGDDQILGAHRGSGAKMSASQPSITARALTRSFRFARAGTPPSARTTVSFLIGRRVPPATYFRNRNLNSKVIIIQA